MKFGKIFFCPIQVLIIVKYSLATDILAKIFGWGGQFGQTREYYILTMNNNLNYQYLFGKNQLLNNSMINILHMNKY